MIQCIAWSEVRRAPIQEEREVPTEQLAMHREQLRMLPPANQMSGQGSCQLNLQENVPQAKH